MSADRSRKRGKRKIKRACLFFALNGFAGLLFAGIIFFGFTEKNRSQRVEIAEAKIEAEKVLQGPVMEKGKVLAYEREHEEVPDFSIGKENYTFLLVNSENPLEEDYKPELEEAENHYMVDSRIAEDLMRMLEAAREDGLDPLICSAYRSTRRQKELYDEQYRKWRYQGYSEEEAYSLAATNVAVPGTSEHATGLAVDIVSRGYQILDEKQEQTEEAKWLMANCHRYGFILRYPNGKTELTGIIYEPWHYRYVGVELATYLTEEGLCLEEYLDSITY